jgi:L-alanine-DL-glutamate epimerase-like enolase superfamily enzyme
METIIKQSTVKIWKARLEAPFRISSGVHDILYNVLLRLELKNGITGYGEAAVATHLTGETVEGTRRNLRSILPDLAGKDITGFLSLARSFREKLTGNRAALAAAEMALLDCYTRHRGIPLWRWFGQRARIIKTDITVVIGSEEEARRFSRRFFARGFRAFKIKIGRDFDLDIKRTIAVHANAKKCRILLDANQAYTAREALQLLKDLKKHHVIPALMEQPVPKDDWEGLREVTRKSGVRVAADESASSLEEAKKIIRGRYADVINIKLMKTGILEALAVAKLAQTKGTTLMMGSMMESPLAAAAAAHFSSSMGGFEFIDLDTPFFLKDRITGGFHPAPNGLYDLRKIKRGIGVQPLFARHDP